VGLWWQWQDLNLLPWDYDYPTSAWIMQKPLVLSFFISSDYFFLLFQVPPY